MAQNQPVDDMQILMDKAKADKKYVVAQNMGLTEAEAKGFWPIYDAYQNDLAGINQRPAGLIKSYAQAYNADTLTDGQAQSLLADMIAIEESEVTLKTTCIPKLRQSPPWQEGRSYLQIENKIRAVVKFQLVGDIFLARSWDGHSPRLRWSGNPRVRTLWSMTLSGSLRDSTRGATLRERSSRFNFMYNPDGSFWEPDI